MMSHGFLQSVANAKSDQRLQWKINKWSWKSHIKRREGCNCKVCGKPVLVVLRVTRGLYCATHTLHLSEPECGPFTFLGNVKREHSTCVFPPH